MIIIKKIMNFIQLNFKLQQRKKEKKKLML